MATDLRSETDRLQAQRQLLETALATGLGGQQRRVQRTLLRENTAELALAERALRAAAAGWEPFEPSPDWFWGYVEDPRFLKGRTRLVSILLSLPLAAFGAWLLFQRWEAMPAIAGALVLLLGLPVALEGILGSIAHERDLQRMEHSPAALSHPPALSTCGAAPLHIFNAPMPAGAIVAYRRAKASGLFDTFVVHIPRAEDFRRVEASEAPSLGLLDPVLAGRIGRHSFLIAQWDLAEDLKQADSV